MHLLTRQRFTIRCRIQAACKTLPVDITGRPSGGIVASDALKELHRQLVVQMPGLLPQMFEQNQSRLIASRIKPSIASFAHDPFISSGSFCRALRIFACVAGSSPA